MGFLQDIGQLPGIINQNIIKPVENVAGNIAHGIVDPITRTATAVSASPLGYILPGGRPQDHIEGMANQIKDPAARAVFRSKAYSSLLGNAGFGMNDSPATIGSKFVGNAAQTALTAAAPGVDNLIGKGVAKVLPAVLPKIIPKVATGALTGAALGGPFNVASLASDGTPLNQQNVTDALKQGTITGGLLGGAVPAVGEAATKYLPQALNAVKQAQQELKPSTIASKTASQVSGLHPSSIINENEAGTLRDYADYKTGSYKPPVSVLNQLEMQSRNAAKTAGIDVATGSPIQITDRIYNYLSQRTQHVQSMKSSLEGGYVGVGKSPINRTQLTGKALDIPNAQLASGQAMGRALGMSEAQVAEAAKPPALGIRPKVTPLEADSQKQMAMSSKLQPTAADNTAKNPLKVSIPEVKPGNYEQARINPQLASHPVDFATGEALKAQKGLKIDNSTFGKMVEGTIKPSTLAEQKAVNAYTDMTNRAHATSQSLGGNTAYIGDTKGVNNYFNHKWDLSSPEQQAKFDQIAQKQGTVDPYSFGGIDNQPRVFKTVAEGEAAGFKLAHSDPSKAIEEYGKGSSYALRQQALIKGFTEADMANPQKAGVLDMGRGQSLPLSDKGMQESKGYKNSPPTTNKVLQAYRTTNRVFKQILLSASEFHPINISALKAGPALALRGHPLMAAKGIFDTFATQAVPRYSDALQSAALKDGTIEASARIGTPIKFGSDYSAGGKLSIGKSGLGEKMIFERAMPAMHIQMVKGALSDLTKRGVPLDSPEAHALGTRINEIMGFVNTEVKNLDKGNQQRLGDLALAPQFTRSKWATLKSAGTDWGKTNRLAGDYARSAVIGNSAAALTVSLALGYLAKQKSDNIKDLVLRSIFHPSVPTPMQDKKGNTQELGLPATYSSEMLSLAGFSLVRGSDGHLNVEWKPGNIPGNAANYGRARLAVLPADALKVATNNDYANRPLYDPNASPSVKAAQGATTLIGGSLPIGLQGLMHTDAVKGHLPQPVQQVLDASSPGSNPIVKSAMSAFGLTPRTDQTVGKGLQTKQYYDALDAAKSGLNPNDLAAYNSIHQETKNPVTGQYVIQPTVFDTAAKASLYEQHPNVLAADNKLNQTMASQGQSIDPFYKLNPTQQQAYLAYSKMPPGGADRSNWTNTNSSWATPFENARSSFFSSLPAGDPNKPKAPITYPSAPPQTASAQTAYYAIQDPAAKAQFLTAHPDVVAQMDKQVAYTNAMRTAQGYSPLRTYPAPSAYVQSKLSSMTGMSSKQKAQVYADPQVAQWSQQDAIYNLTKGSALAEIQGNSPSSKTLKAAASIGHSTLKNPDGSVALKYSDPQGGTGGASVQPGATSPSSFKFGPSPRTRAFAALKGGFKAPKALKMPRALSTRGVRLASSHIAMPRAPRPPSQKGFALRKRA